MAGELQIKRSSTASATPSALLAGELAINTVDEILYYKNNAGTIKGLPWGNMSGTQTANRVFAGPTTGSAATPTFRALVAADIPDLSSSYVALTGTQTVGGNKTFSGNTTMGGTVDTSGSAFNINFNTADLFSGGISVRKRGTTSDATAAVGNSSEIGYHNFYGWNGSSYVRGAHVIVSATEAWTTSNNGAKYAIITILNAAAGASAFTINQGKTVLDNTSNWNSSKFDSVGTAWSSSLAQRALIFNGNSAERPEISWHRGSRNYPEFALRQHPTGDNGGQIFSGTGTAAPTMTMSFSGGKVGIQQATPTALLHIAAGTATASTAPIKLTNQGTALLTTPEVGAAEFGTAGGNNVLFFTRSGTTRESILTVSAVNTVSPTSPNRTLTVVGPDGTTYYIHAKTTND